MPVELIATNPAKAYGLHPRKGAIAIGSDADLVVWDEGERTIRNAELHHAVDYTPYEGQRLVQLACHHHARGEVVWDGAFHPRLGRGELLACGAPSLLPARQFRPDVRPAPPSLSPFPHPQPKEFSP
ncbi:MAG: amidohydrolase family protein [Burkholderiaceae bacterium]